jgi:hypothetical protein
MNTAHECSMVVHRTDGSLMHFREHPSGLYVFDPDLPSDTPSPHSPGLTLVTTVASNKNVFSSREVQSADLARQLYRFLGRPSEADFQYILCHKLIRNCPITPLDAARALKIYCLDISALKGKTNKGPASSRAPTFQATVITPSILAEHRDITLCVHFFLYTATFFYTTSAVASVFALLPMFLIGPYPLS